jgi:hypothetical protein
MTIEVAADRMEPATDKQRRAKPVATPKYRPQPGDQRYGRSRVSNGSVLLPGIDQRSTWVRRCKDIIASHLSDLGGADNTSAAERSIVRRAAVLTTELERLEARFALAGEADSDDLDLYQRTAGNLRRLLEAVGLQRRARTVEPTLADILNEEAAE